MQKKFNKALMTNRSKFRVGNIGHGRYSVVVAWISNFCQRFSNPLGPFR